MPVFGRLTIIVGDGDDVIDILAIIISVGVAVGDRFICPGCNVTVGVDDKIKIGVGVLDGIGVGVLVAGRVRVGKGAAAFC